MDGRIKKYIDDGLFGEQVCNLNAACHITQSKVQKFLHARKSEEYLKLTAQNASKIGMQINAAKTKMICITVAKNSMVNSFINLPDNSQISGSETLKMLGFVFGRRPNVAHIKKKFHSKLWILGHLIRANLPKSDLFAVYQSFILPVIEYCCIVYHCLLSEEMSDKLEALQKRALKIICGGASLYASCLDKAGIRTLKDRRTEAFKKFAIKISHRPRFTNDWLTQNDKGRALRYTEKYKVTKSNFDRLKYGPLNCIRTILNNM